MEGEAPELRWVLHFQEPIKPMVLNTTNGQLIAAILKSEETDEWIGKKVSLYDDPTISFGGKLVGGIRVRPAPESTAGATDKTRMYVLNQLKAAPGQENRAFVADYLLKQGWIVLGAEPETWDLAKVPTSKAGIVKLAEQMQAAQDDIPM